MAKLTASKVKRCGRGCGRCLKHRKETSMSEKIEAVSDGGAFQLCASNGCIVLDCGPLFNPDDVAAVVAEAKRQREEIERRKRMRIVTCPLSGGEYASIEWVAGGDVMVRHGGCHPEWSTFAADVIAAYRELVEVNKHA